MNWYTPVTMEELAAALAQGGESSRVIAGGTDYTIHLRQGKANPGALIYPGRIPALREIMLTEDSLRIGAMATMAELSLALAAVPEFAAIADAAGGVGSPQIRSKATLVGNLCNASPAGDMLPIAKLYDMVLEVLDGNGRLTDVSVSDFFLGPGKTALQPGQAVTAVRANRTAVTGWVSAFHKIGFRSYVSIARIGMGVLLHIDAAGVISDARLTLGAVANVPIRVYAAERLMQGKPLDRAMLEKVTAVVSRTVHDNCRPANRLYKTEAARGLCADVFAQLEKRMS
ncbi:MAG: FAD binding domain-containing protein [Oscillospiraceae bacterium]|nr:FAD binding domain-containing protein [Oscillospiraceae bacterium]